MVFWLSFEQGKFVAWSLQRTDFNHDSGHHVIRQAQSHSQRNHLIEIYRHTFNVSLLHCMYVYYIPFDHSPQQCLARTSQIHQRKNSQLVNINTIMKIILKNSITWNYFSYQQEFGYIIIGRHINFYMVLYNNLLINYKLS